MGPQLQIAPRVEPQLTVELAREQILFNCQRRGQALHNKNQSAWAEAQQAFLIWRVLLAALALLVLLVVPVSAQQNVCDQVPQTQVTLAVGDYHLIACEEGPTPNGWLLTVDGRDYDLGMLSPTGSANATGKLPYALPISLTTEGTYVVSSAAYNLDTNGARLIARSQTAPITVTITPEPDPVPTCLPTLTPAAASVNAAGGTVAATLAFSDAGCAWTANASATWLSVTPASGTGSAALSVIADVNTSTSRTAAITVGGATLTVTQDAAAPVPTGTLAERSVGSGTGTTSASVTVTAPAGSLLLAAASGDGPGTANTQTVTVSGGGLTWTREIRANGRPGHAEFWTARVGSSGLVNALITARHAYSGYFLRFTVIALDGAAVGAKVGANGTSGAAKATITPTKVGSFLYGVGSDWSKVQARTLLSGQRKISESAPSGLGTFWSQGLTAGSTTASTAPYAVGTSAPTSTNWDFVAIEIVPAAVAPPPPPPCTYSVSPVSLLHGYGGQSSAVAVTASDASCAWTASSPAGWLSVVPSTGTGPGSVTLTSTANTGSERSVSVTVAGQTVTVTQAAAPPPNTPPVVTQTGNQVTLTVTATDPQGVASVTFELDGIPTVVMTAPYTYVLDVFALPPGDHVVTVKATDSLGLSSAPVSIYTVTR